MTAIRNTIVSTLAAKLNSSEEELEANYNNHISVAEEALLEREWAIADELKAVALRETGFNEADVDELFEQVGLTQRPKPEPEQPETPAEDLTVEERVARLEEGQGKIVEALDTLTRLAERHLGASL